MDLEQAHSCVPSLFACFERAGSADKARGDTLGAMHALAAFVETR
jgi:hypothetical protein